MFHYNKLPIIFLINGIILTEQFFEEIRISLLTSMALEKLHNLQETPREREARLRIEKIKKSGKRKDNNTSNPYINFEKNIIILKYEFGFSLEEIKNLTLFAMNTILSYTSGSVQYKTSVAAYAAGNTKKIKFITDKEKK